MRQSFIERTTRVNVGVRVENHDDNGRNAVKSVPVTRVRIANKNKYKANGAKRDWREETLPKKEQGK